LERKKEGSEKNGCFKGSRPAWPLLAWLALLTLFVTVSCGVTSGKQSAKDTADNEQASADKLQVGTKEPQEAGQDLGHPSLGEEDAPVVMTEYADFQ
jgi:hypothetical protein